MPTGPGHGGTAPACPRRASSPATPPATELSALRPPDVISAMAERIAEVGFESGGERCAGWLHLPEGEGPHPCVTMLHSTAGLRQMRCYAARGRAFAEAGVATLQFECR